MDSQLAGGKHTSTYLEDQNTVKEYEEDRKVEDKLLTLMEGEVKDVF